MTGESHGLRYQAFWEFIFFSVRGVLRLPKKLKYSSFRARQRIQK